MEVNQTDSLTSYFCPILLDLNLGFKAYSLVSLDADALAKRLFIPVALGVFEELLCSKPSSPSVNKLRLAELVGKVGQCIAGGILMSVYNMHPLDYFSGKPIVMSPPKSVHLLAYSFCFLLEIRSYSDRVENNPNYNSLSYFEA